MKSILLICKEITQECEDLEGSSWLDSHDRKNLRDAKASLSESLTFLMQATKEHASNNGPSLLTKIEDEIKTLSVCLVDILDILKIIQSSTSTNPLSGESRGLDSNRDTLRVIEPPNYDQGGDPPALEVPDLLVRIQCSIHLL